MPNTRLTDHFTLQELTITNVHMDNTPPAMYLPNILQTATKLETVRTLLGGVPLVVSSGYRSLKVNAAVGGAVDSSHLYGQAADFIVPSFGEPRDVCLFLLKHLPNDFIYDQIIYEWTWTHIGFGPKNRRRALTKDGKGYTQGIA